MKVLFPCYFWSLLQRENVLIVHLSLKRRFNVLHIVSNFWWDLSCRFWFAVVLDTIWVGKKLFVSCVVVTCSIQLHGTLPWLTETSLFHVSVPKFIKSRTTLLFKVNNLINLFLNSSLSQFLDRDFFFT